MPRCLACARSVRRLHGEYGLCRTCDRRLEVDICEWSLQLSRDLDRLTAFDSYYADRETNRKQS